MRTNYFAVILSLVLFATACGPGNGDGGGNDRPFAGGTLVTAGSTFVQTRDLATASGWDDLLKYNLGNALPAVHDRSMTLYMAHFDSGPDDFHVDSHDLDTFDRDGQLAFTWPDTGLAHRVRGLAVSPDGGHVAGVLSHVADTFLEVLALESAGPESLLQGFEGVTGADLVWLDDTVLAFAMDLGHVSHPDAAALGGGIVAIDLAGLMAGGPEGEVPMGIVVGFSQEEWSDGSAGTTVNIDRVVHSLAVSPDGDQLAYTYRDDVWLKDLREPTSAPRQLTTGPFPHTGAAFSPDGTSLALVEYVESRTSSVHLIPIGVTEPLLLDSDRPEGRRYYLDGVVARRILAWLP